MLKARPNSQSPLIKWRLFVRQYLLQMGLSVVLTFEVTQLRCSSMEQLVVLPQRSTVTLQLKLRTDSKLALINNFLVNTFYILTLM